MLQEEGLFRRNPPLADGVSGPNGGEEQGHPGDEKLFLTQVARFRVPIGGQEVDLQQVDYAHGGMSLLRLRIREGRRFTIFDIDPATARQWGEMLCRWADGQPASASTDGEALQIKENQNG